MAVDLDIPLTPGMWAKIQALEACELKSMNSTDSGDDKPGSDD